MAFTAAVCSEYLSIGCRECWFQTKSYVIPQKIKSKKKKTVSSSIYQLPYKLKMLRKLTLLSFPPDANWQLSYDHLSPQT